MRSLVKFDRHVASLSPEKFLLENWHSLRGVRELEVVEILAVVHVALRGEVVKEDSVILSLELLLLLGLSNQLLRVNKILS